MNARNKNNAHKNSNFIISYSNSRVTFMRVWSKQFEFSKATKTVF